MTEARMKKRDSGHEKSCPHGVSRRGFIASVGTGALGAVVAARAGGGEPPANAAGELKAITLEVNGQRQRVQVEPRWTLLYVLRERLGLTGSKPGCERGECGACTVLIDGVPRYACLTLAVEAEGHAVTTVEGLLDGEELGPVQQAFAAEDALQCGFCTPGQIMAAEGLLRANPSPSVGEIRMAMSGNLCRCGTYPHITKAVRRAAAARQGGGR
jgi:xanthine dehydrogenase YagT iron-sulfur-binding subunit